MVKNLNKETQLIAYKLGQVKTNLKLKILFFFLLNLNFLFLLTP